MFGLNNSVVIFLDNDLIFSNILYQEGLIMIESVLINNNGLVLHRDLNFLNTISTYTVDVFLSLEDTLVEGLEGMVELYDNLVELEWILNQIWLSKNNNLRVDVIKYNKDSVVLDLADDYLAKE